MLEEAGRSRLRLGERQRGPETEGEGRGPDRGGPWGLLPSPSVPTRFGARLELGLRVCVVCLPRHASAGLLPFTSPREESGEHITTRFSAAVRASGSLSQILAEDRVDQPSSHEEYQDRSALLSNAFE